MNDIRVIGLTGPSGSGKTEVADVFKRNGYVIIDADKLAREVIEYEEVRRKIRETFGDYVFENESINRKKLAEVAFKNNENEIRLNEIMHPSILKKAKETIRESIDDGKTDILFDAPLLLESGADQFCTVVVAVISDYEKRKERIIKRDNLSDLEAQERINIQKPDDFYTDRAEYVIYNNGSINKLKEEAEKLLEKV